MFVSEWISSVLKYTTIIISSFCMVPLVDICVQKIKQFDTLRKAVQKMNKDESFISSVFISFGILKKTCNVYINNFLYGSELVGKHFYLVEYYHNMNWYYIPVFVKKGPKPIIEEAYTIKENRKINHTELIKKIAGPNVDFYGMNIHPTHLGIKEELCIKTDSGEKRIASTEILKI